MKSAESSDLLSPAAEAFAGFLARIGDGEEVDFEAFCGERSEIEPKLRRLHANWRAFRGAVDDLSSAGASDSNPLASTDSSASVLLETLREDSRPHRYERKHEIARGGMGAVYKVWDRNLRRNLAMKVLVGRGALGGKVEPRALSRFLDEAQITGQLEHPGILPIHELGLDAVGRVYFTMPLVRGENLQKIIEHTRTGEDDWTLTRALGVVVRVCEAMGYAHSKGVVHRDLKPANVMVGAFGEAYVMDWGLARVLGEEDRKDIRVVPEAAVVSTEVRTVRHEMADGTPESPLVTMDGDVVGTPVYMSPEQAHGWIGEVGPQTDVYAIGAMLYHLLTGHRPYLSPAEEDSALAVLRAVKSRPPRRIHELAPEVPAELEAICEKAMAREPKGRYASTMELAADLRAFLEMRVVRAYETGAVAETRKWVQRNKRLAAASAAGVVVLVLGFAVSTFLFFESRTNERDAVEQRNRADQNAERLADELRSSTIHKGRLTGRTGELRLAEELLWGAHLQDPSDPESRWALWELYANEPCLSTLSPPLSEEPALRDVLLSHDEALIFVAASAARQQPGVIGIWEAGSLRHVASLSGHENEVKTLSLHPDGRFLATASLDGTIGLWDLVQRQRVRTLRTDGAAFDVARFNRDGSRLLSGDHEGRLDVWDPATGEHLDTLHHGGYVFQIAFHPAEDLFASSTIDGAVRIWRGLDSPTAPTSMDLEGHPYGVPSLAFSPDGRTLASGDFDSTIKLWDVETGELQGTLHRANGRLYALAFDRTGRTLFAGGLYGVDHWDLDTREVRRTFTSMTPIANMVVSADQKRLGEVTGTRLRFWDLAPRGEIRLEGHDGTVVAALGAGGERLATGDQEGRVRIWETATGRLLETWEPAKHGIRSLGFDPNGRYVAVGSGGVLRIHAAGTGEVVHAFEGLSGVTRDLVDFSPDGRTVLFARRGGACEVRDLASGELVAELDSDGVEVVSARFDPRGRFAVVVTRDWPRGAWLTVWSPTWERLFQSETNTAWKSGMSPDGERIVLGNYRNKLQILNLEEGRIERTLEGHTGLAYAADWHPTDPRLVASCGSDGTVRLWNADNGRCLLTIDAFGDAEALWIRFAPDGRGLYVAGQAGNVAMLDLEYFDRHIAGNVRHQIERLQPEPGDPAVIEELEAWADEVLARPWPRLGPPD